MSAADAAVGSSDLHARIEAVVIGASAGGVDGLSALLPALADSTRAALLIVLHLPREHRSVLCDIYARTCPLHVKEAEDKEPVQAATVYFAPPDYHLLVDSGPRLALSVDEPVHYSRPSIDVLFESAADVYGPRLLGVILTGASQDGAAGLAAVRAAGGITAVQQPGDSFESQLPRAALRLGPADFVLPLREMALLFGSLGAPRGGST
jgi:two-component system chemotaxis response regulator CheB